MKKTSTLLVALSLILLYSCSNSIDDQIAIPAADPSLRSTYNEDEDPLAQFVDIPMHITLTSSAGNARYLSIINEKIRVGMSSKDDGSGRQQWVIQKMPMTNIFNYKPYCIKSLGYANVPGKDFRNWKVITHYGSYENFDVSDIWYTKPGSDDFFSASPFVFLKDKESNTYKIHQYLYRSYDLGDYDFINKTLAVMTAKKAEQDAYVAFAYMPRADEKLMTWELHPIDIFELQKIEYYMQPGDVVTQMPDFITDAIVVNNTSLEQSMTMTFADKATEQSKFSETESISLSIKAGTSFGVPGIMGGSIDATIISSNSWSFEKSESKEDSRTYSFTIKVAPYTTVKGQASVLRYNAKVTYKATFKGQSTGKIVSLSGSWEGVRASTISYVLTESKTGKVLKSFTGIPSSVVDLTK